MARTRKTIEFNDQQIEFIEMLVKNRGETFSTVVRSIINQEIFKLETNLNKENTKIGE